MNFKEIQWSFYKYEVKLQLCTLHAHILFYLSLSPFLSAHRFFSFLLHFSFSILLEWSCFNTAKPKRSPSTLKEFQGPAAWSARMWATAETAAAMPLRVRGNPWITPCHVVGLSIRERTRNSYYRDLVPTNSSRSSSTTGILNCQKHWVFCNQHKSARYYPSFWLATLGCKGAAALTDQSSLTSH